MKKLISIIIPIHNAKKYLFDTITSLKNQTESNWECLLIDDGSIDNSAEIIKLNTKDDMRFNYLHQKNGGPSKARNKGLELANGEYIVFLDADDYLLPDYIKSLSKLYETNKNNNTIYYVNMLLGNESNILDYTKPNRISTFNSKINFDIMYSYFNETFSFIPGCLMIPKKYLHNIKWNENMSYSEDWDLYLRLCKEGLLFESINKDLIIYRNTSNSLSKNYINIYKANYIILQNYFEWKNISTYLKRCAKIFSKNLLQYLLKKIDIIVFPKHINLKLTIMNCIVIIPYSFFYTITTLLKRK